MKRIVQPHPASAENMVFTEGIDYFQIGDHSLWGYGDPLTLHFLETTPLQGKWLDLGAGDGRYAVRVLRQVDHLFAVDIDCSALSKLWFRSPRELHLKLHLAKIDIQRPLPFGAYAFDGVFCTGILHLFPERSLLRIVSEIDRVVKPGGRVVVDFATDVERYSKEGSRLLCDAEPQYCLDTASALLDRLFEGYSTRQWSSTFEDDLTGIPQHECLSRGNFVLFVAEKPQ